MSIRNRRNRRNIWNITRAIQTLVFECLDRILYEDDHRNLAREEVAESKGFADFNMI